MFGIGLPELIILFSFSIPAIVGGLLAKSKGRSVFAWFILCYIFLFPIIILLFLHPLKEVEGKYRQCPKCREIIEWRAQICKHCKSDIETVKSYITMSDLTIRVTLSALIVGSIAFSAGFFGPIFFSTSNLGPLLGIFLTGPVGTLAGVLWGIVSSAKNANARVMRAMLAWLSAVWVLTLLYTLFIAGLATQWVLPAIGLQGLIIASSVFLLYCADTRTRLSQSVKRCGPVAITVLALIMLMTVFPPITKPWWGKPKAAQEDADSTAPLPKVALILDERFDASHHVPLFAIDRRTLVLEWLISAVAALGVSLLIIGARSRSRSDVGPPNSD
jgi:hypothetical protein